MFWDINDDFCMYMLAGFKKMLYLCSRKVAWKSVVIV